MDIIIHQIPILKSYWKLFRATLNKEYSLPRLSLFSSSLEHSPSSLVNVAYKRPAFQISTQDEYRASNAVDEENSCAQTQKETDPWWRVDLGKSVWVESVLIASRTDSNFKELSDVEIRIGKASNHWRMMLCYVWFIHVPQTSRTTGD